MNIGQWLLSGITITTIFELLKKVVSRMWEYLPAVKRLRKDQKKLKAFLEEELENVVTLEALQTTFYDRYSQEVIAILREMGVSVNNEREIIVCHRIQSAINQWIEEVNQAEVEMDRKQDIRLRQTLEDTI